MSIFIKKLLVKLLTKWKETKKTYADRKELTFTCSTCGTGVNVPINEELVNKQVPACPICGESSMVYDRLHYGYLQMIGILPGAPEII